MISVVKTPLKNVMPNTIVRSLPIIKSWTCATQRLRNANKENRTLASSFKDTLERIEAAARGLSKDQAWQFKSDRIWEKLEHALAKTEQRPSGALFENPKQFFASRAGKCDWQRARQILNECEAVARQLEHCITEVPDLDQASSDILDNCSNLIRACLGRIRSLESHLDKEIPALKRRNMLATALIVAFFAITLVAVIAGGPGFNVLAASAFAALLISANVGNTGIALWLQWRSQKQLPWNLMKNAVMTFEQECDRLAGDIQYDVARSRSRAEQVLHDERLADLNAQHQRQLDELNELANRYEATLADLDAAALHQGVIVEDLATQLSALETTAIATPPLRKLGTANLPPILEAAPWDGSSRQAISAIKRRISEPGSSKEYLAAQGPAAYENIGERVEARARSNESLSQSGSASPQIGFRVAVDPSETGSRDGETQVVADIHHPIPTLTIQRRRFPSAPSQSSFSTLTRSASESSDSDCQSIRV